MLASFLGIGGQPHFLGSLYGFVFVDAVWSLPERLQPAFGSLWRALEDVGGSISGSFWRGECDIWEFVIS